MSDKNKTKIFEYKLGEKQQNVHAVLIETKELFMTKLWFEANKDSLITKFLTYENFNFLAQQYLWETYFKYNIETLKYIVHTAKDIFTKNKELSTSEQNILFFFHCMSVSPSENPKEEPKKQTIKEEVKQPLTLESLLGLID